MEKFYIRYHIVGNSIVSEVKEFESFAQAVTSTSRRLTNEVLAIVKEDGHVIEIQKKYITYHEVMDEDAAKKERDKNYLISLVGSATKKG